MKENISKPFTISKASLLKLTYKYTKGRKYLLHTHKRINKVNKSTAEIENGR